MKNTGYKISENTSILDPFVSTENNVKVVSIDRVFQTFTNHKSHLNY